MIKFQRFASLGSKVILFEPQPRLHTLLDISMTMNEGFNDRMYLFKNIVSDNDQELYIHYDASLNMGGSKVFRADDTDPTQIGISAFKIKSIAIEKVLQIEKLQKPTTLTKASQKDYLIFFMKVDVEGFEYEAIKSSGKFIQK